MNTKNEIMKEFETGEENKSGEPILKRKKRVGADEFTINENT